MSKVINVTDHHGDVKTVELIDIITIVGQGNGAAIVTFNNGVIETDMTYADVITAIVQSNTNG